MLKSGSRRFETPHFEALHFEARQLERLVSDLQTLSLAGTGELPLYLEKANLEPLLLNTLLSGFAELVQARGVVLLLELTEVLPPLDLDPQRMTQILGNLLENALRHTLPGESVTVGGLLWDSKVRLFVRDTGEGIAPVQLAVISERFYRTNQAHSSAPEDGSSGLGLAISHALVVAQRGTLRAEST